MDIVLIVATLVVAVAVLFMAVTFNTRSKQNTAPLVDGAVEDISGKIEATAENLRRQVADELQQDREQLRLDGRKIQGRLDHADSRTSSLASQFQAELETIRRLVEQIGAQQDKLSEDLRELDDQVAQLGESLARPDAAAQAAAQTAEEAGQQAEETPDRLTAIVPGQLYAERLRFAIVRIQPEPLARSERRYRLQVERQVGELRGRPLGVVHEPSTIIFLADHEEGFRKRLGEAAADYFASKLGDPATEQWITQNAYPETAVVEVCNRISSGLETIVERPLEKTGTELRLWGPGAASAAGIGADLVLQPVTEPLDHVTTFLEVTGVVVGMATGLHPVALASMKLLAQERYHDLVTRSIMEAARQLFNGPEASAEEPALQIELEPARAMDGTLELNTAPTTPSPSIEWEPSPEPDLGDLGPEIEGPGLG